MSVRDSKPVIIDYIDELSSAIFGAEENLFDRLKKISNFKQIYFNYIGETYSL